MWESSWRYVARLNPGVSVAAQTETFPYLKIFFCTFYVSFWHKFCDTFSHILHWKLLLQHILKRPIIDIPLRVFVHVRAQAVPLLVNSHVFLALNHENVQKESTHPPTYPPPSMKITWSIPSVSERRWGGWGGGRGRCRGAAGKGGSQRRPACRQNSGECGACVCVCAAATGDHYMCRLDSACPWLRVWMSLYSTSYLER